MQRMQCLEWRLMHKVSAVSYQLRPWGFSGDGEKLQTERQKREANSNLHWLKADG